MQCIVSTRTGERTRGTFSNALDIYRCIQMQICNIICKCVESVVRQQKSIARYPCAHPAHGHPLLALAAGLIGPHSNDTFILDQNRPALAYSVSSSHLLEGETCFVSQDRVQFMLHYLCAFHFAARNRFFFSSLLFFCTRFLREKRHMSYCCSGCGGLNMYNTSRHDHFL